MGLMFVLICYGMMLVMWNGCYFADFLAFGVEVLFGGGVVVKEILGEEKRAYVPMKKTQDSLT